MIDRSARHKAASLVRGLGDGGITNDDFVDEWPRAPRDRALRAVSRTLWFSYDDNYTHRLVGAHALNDLGRRLFERCALFLDSEFEYEWPRDRLYSGDGYTLKQIWLSLGLLALSGRYFMRCYHEQEAAGDSSVWPFFRQTDLDASAAKSVGMEQARTVS